MSRKPKDNGDGNGGGNGAANGAANGDSGAAAAGSGRNAKTWDAFVLEVHGCRADMFHEVWCEGAGDGARSIDGGKLGRIALEPLDDLEDRILHEWGGPRTYIVRTKFKDGRWGPQGRLPWLVSHPGRIVAPGGNGSAAGANSAAAAAGPIVNVAPAVALDPFKQASSALDLLNGMKAVLGFSAPAAAGDPPAKARTLPELIDEAREVASKLGAEDKTVGVIHAASPIIKDAINSVKDAVAAIAGARGGETVAQRETANEQFKLKAFELELLRKKLDMQERVLNARLAGHGAVVTTAAAPPAAQEATTAPPATPPNEETTK